jgi:hypothetical protein
MVNSKPGDGWVGNGKEGNREKIYRKVRGEEEFRGDGARKK